MQPELTLAQVLETGRPAAHASTSCQGLHPEWTFEDGSVWLVFRNGEKVHSRRQSLPEKSPQRNWHHEQDCDCRYCASAHDGESRGQAGDAQDA